MSGHSSFWEPERKVSGSGIEAEEVGPHHGGIWSACNRKKSKGQILSVFMKHPKYDYYVIAIVHLGPIF